MRYDVACNTCTWTATSYSCDEAYNLMTRHQHAAYVDDRVAGIQYPQEHKVTIEPKRI